MRCQKPVATQSSRAGPRDQPRPWHPPGLDGQVEQSWV